MLIALQQTVDQVKRRRSMYIGEGFDSLVAFFTGYSIAVKQLSGIDLMDDIQDWVKATYRREFSVLWPYYLRDIVARSDDDRATELFFTTVLSFVEHEQGGKNGDASS